MGVCVKLASAEYAAGEIVFYRGLIGALVMLAVARWQGGTLRTPVPAMHFWRSLSGVISLCLWFYAIGDLPLATAMTLNYMSSVWMALFLIGGAVVARQRARRRPAGRARCCVGFAGVGLILRPTIEREPALARPDRPALGRDRRDGLPAGHRARPRRRAGVPDRLLLLARRRRRRRPRRLLWTGVHASHTLARRRRCCSPSACSRRVAQLMMTRAYATGRTLVNASLQYLGIAWSLRLRRAAVRRPGDRRWRWPAWC